MKPDRQRLHYIQHQFSNTKSLISTHPLFYLRERADRLFLSFKHSLELCQRVQCVEWILKWNKWKTGKKWVRKPERLSSSACCTAVVRLSLPQYRLQPCRWPIKRLVRPRPSLNHAETRLDGHLKVCCVNHTWFPSFVQLSGSIAQARVCLDKQIEPIKKLLLLQKKQTIYSNCNHTAKQETDWS